MGSLIKGVKEENVAVALSGGVDSAVAAFLLKKSGAKVFGITMKIGPTLDEDIKKAKIVSKFLGIKHYVVDLKELFEREVIDYFVSESLKGKNPNPCVPCNQKIKFGALFKAAEKKGAESLATGHYARLLKRSGHIILQRPVDVKKDQSYVLSMLPKRIFSKLIFPLGNLTKSQVRSIAKKNSVPVFDKKESSDLCFLNMEKGDFIEKRLGKKLKSGNIVSGNGKVLGKHRGFVHYTVGQRKGLGLEKKYYVKEIHMNKNEVVVDDRKGLYLSHFYVENPNWVSIEEPKKPLNVEIIIRNKMKPVKARIFPEGKRVRVVPENPIWAVSSGQLAAFIKRDIVLGGGWIV